MDGSDVALDPAIVVALWFIVVGATVVVLFVAWTAAIRRAKRQTAKKVFIFKLILDSVVQQILVLLSKARCSYEEGVGNREHWNTQKVWRYAKLWLDKHKTFIKF